MPRYIHAGDTGAVHELKERGRERERERERESK